MLAELRKSGLDIIGDISWGTHLCSIYETQEDLFAIMALYIKTGLENREFCVCVIFPPTSEGETIQALRRDIPGIDQYLAARDVEILPHTGWNLKGGSAPTPLLSGAFEERLTQALSRGYGGMRVISAGPWPMRNAFKEIAAYEEAVNSLIPDQPTIMLCTYCLSLIPAAMVFDLIHTHDFVISRRHGNWEAVKIPASKRSTDEIGCRQLEGTIERVRRGVVEHNHTPEAFCPSQLPLQAAIEAAGVGVWDWDLVGGQISWAGHHERLFGYDPGEFDGTYGGFRKRVHPEDVEELERELKRARETRSEYAHEYRVVWPDGSTHWIEGRGMFVYNQAGKPVRMLGAVIDVTPNKQVEAALLRSESELTKAQQLARIGSWTLEIGTETVKGSKEFYRIFDLEETAFGNTYQGFLSRVHAQDRERVSLARANARLIGTPFEVEYRVATPTGLLRHIRETGYAVKDQEGNPSFLFGTSQDITERKCAEEELKATGEQLRALAAKLEAVKEEESRRIGQEIHDEVGSAMTILRWDLEGLAEPSSDVMSREDSSGARKKIQKIIKRVDTFSGNMQRIAAELRPPALDDLGLIEAIEYLVRQFQAHKRISCRFESLAGSVTLGKEEATVVFRVIQEALTNVLRHAQATKVNVIVEKGEGEWIFEVRDNGRGITEEEKRGPFSLGLIGMRERASLIGGTIEVTGSPGKGTVVTLRVPFSTQPGPGPGRRD